MPILGCKQETLVMIKSLSLQFQIPGADSVWDSTPGVDVMITIFCDFCQISAKKLAFFSKTPILWSQFLQKLALFWVKNANFFAEFFGEN
jgi:hypothetical protein